MSDEQEPEQPTVAAGTGAGRAHDPDARVEKVYIVVGSHDEAEVLAQAAVDRAQASVNGVLAKIEKLEGHLSGARAALAAARDELAAAEARQSKLGGQR